VPKLLVAVPVSLAALAVLAACGSTSSAPARTTTTLPQLGPPPLAVGPASARDLSAVQRAATHTLTLHAAISLEFVSPPSVPYPPVTATGAFDLPTMSGRELLHDSVGTETLVFLPTEILDRRPVAESSGLPRGRPWIRAAFSQHLDPSHFLEQSLQRLEQDDPAFLLAEIAWGARDAAPLGPRTVDGVRANGYLVHVDAARATSAAAGPSAHGFRNAAAMIEQELGAGMGVPPLVYVWVDGSNRVVALRALTVGNTGGTTLVNLTSFGVTVRLSPPPRSQTVDLDDLDSDPT